MIPEIDARREINEIRTALSAAGISELPATLREIVESFDRLNDLLREPGPRAVARSLAERIAADPTGDFEAKIADVAEAYRRAQMIDSLRDTDVLGTVAITAQRMIAQTRGELVAMVRPAFDKIAKTFCENVRKLPDVPNPLQDLEAVVQANRAEEFTAARDTLAKILAIGVIAGPVYDIPNGWKTIELHSNVRTLLRVVDFPVIDPLYTSGLDHRIDNTDRSLEQRTPFVKLAKLAEKGLELALVAVARGAVPTGFSLATPEELRERVKGATNANRVVHRQATRPHKIEGPDIDSDLGVYD
jgi:hypothetical protein